MENKKKFLTSGIGIFVIAIAIFIGLIYLISATVTIGTNAGFVTTAPTSDPAGNNLDVSGFAFGSNFNSSATAVKITEVGYWNDDATDTSQTAQVALYNDTGAIYPASLLKNASFTTVGGQRWEKVSVDWTISPSTRYWLVVISPQVTTNYNNNGAGNKLVRNAGETVLDNPFESSQTINDEVTSAIYAVWTAGDTTAPKWQTNSTNSTVAGTQILHIVNWTDETALSGYIFSFDNGTGTFTNDSWVAFAGTQNWSNVTKGVNTTVGATIQWKVYANDSSNNLNVTSTFSYVTTSSGLDTTKPQFANIGVNDSTPDILDSVLFSVNWTDNIQLANYTFSWNATGTNCDTWANDSIVTFNGVQNWSNITKQIPAPCVGRIDTIGWRVYAMDNSSNMNISTDTLSFTTTDASLNITQVTPTANANWTQNAFTQWTSQVCCAGSDCGTVNVSLDPISDTATETIVLRNSSVTDDNWGGTEGSADCYCNDTSNFATCGNKISGRADDSKYVGVNFGGYDILYNGHETGHRQDIYLKFPTINDYVPYQKTINGSVYTLVVESVKIKTTARGASFDTGQNDTIFFNQTMHKMLKQWVEGLGQGATTGCPNSSGYNESQYNWSSNKYAIFPTVTWDDYQTWDAKFPANATTDRENPPFDSFWLTNQTFNVTDCLGNLSTCVQHNWTVPTSIVLDWIQNPSTNYGVKIQSNIQVGSSEAELFWFASERNDNPEIQQPAIFITYHYTANLKGGLVNTTAGASPFYTNGSNPQTITLNKNQCQNVSWWVNSTGDVNDSYSFYAYANITNNTAINNQTGIYNITISEVSACSLDFTLSGNLSNGIFFDVSTLPSENLSANGNNGTGITQYNLSITVTGCTSNLSIKTNAPLTSGSTTIPIGNEKYSYNRTDNTVPSTTKSSLTTSYVSIDSGISSTTTYLKFFLNVSANQQAGVYNNTISFQIAET